MRPAAGVAAGAGSAAGSVSSWRRRKRRTPRKTPARVKTLHQMPWPSCVAIGPGQASATPQPIPKTRLPTTWRRSGRSTLQSIRSPVSSARRPRTSRRPTSEVSTAAANIRNRYESWNSSAFRMTSGLAMPVQHSNAPNSAPITAPATSLRQAISDHGLDQEADADRGGEEGGRGGEARDRGHRHPAQPVARRAAARRLRADADQEPARKEDRRDPPAHAARERVGQPAVAVEDGPARDQREQRGADDQPDEEQRAPVEDPLDDGRIAAGHAEARVQQQPDRDHAE